MSDERHVLTEVSASPDARALEAERQRAEQRMRQSEARQSFLLKLSDALATLADPAAIQAAAADLLGQHLQVDHSHFGEDLAVQNIQPREWTPSEIELVREVAERTRAAVARARAEQAVSKSEEKYRTLFDSIDEGVAIVDVLFDEHDKAVDYRLLEFNAAHEAKSGLGREFLGKRVREVMPTIEERVVERIGRVAITGEPVRFEEYVGALNRWFDIYLSRVGGAGSHIVASVFNDITERKRREHHAAFLDKLSQALAVLDTPEEIVRTAGERLAAHLAIDFMNVVDVELGGADPSEARFTVAAAWEPHGVPGPRGSYRAGDYFSDELLGAARAGETVVVCDTDTDPRVDTEGYRAIGMRAFVAVPVLKDGAWPGLISIFTRAARDWRPDEVHLMVEVSHRVFPRIERARAQDALRASEAQFRRLFDTMEQGFAVCHAIRDGRGKMIDYRLVLLNPAYDRHSAGVTPQDALGKRELELFPRVDGWWLDTFQKVLDTGKTIRFERYLAETDRWYEVTAFPYHGDSFAYLYGDISQRKRHEAALAFLAEVSQDLVGAISIDGMMDALVAKVGEHLNVERCMFCEVIEAQDKIVVCHDWHRPGSAGAAGDVAFSVLRGEAFRKICRTGQVVAVADVHHSPLIDPTTVDAVSGISALVCVPLVKDGEWRFALVVHTAAPREWRPDELELLREITTRLWTRLERARAEDALEASEERLRLLLESVKDYAIFTIDPTGLVTSWNDGARRLKGYTAGEILGQPVSRFYLPEDAGKPAREMQRALRTGRSEDESWRVRKDGSRFWGNEIVTPLRSADGRHLGFTKITRDLTGQKAFEDALRQAHDELDQRVQQRTADLANANASLQVEVRERRAGEQQIKRLFERLVSVQEEERRRIARDIHDQLGQAMTALRMNLEAERAWVDGDPARRGQAQRTQQLAEELDRSIDFLTWELRPAALDHLGLPAALQRLVSGWSERFGVAAEFHASRTAGLRLPADAEANLYRLVQEALHNVVKHAGATHVTVLLEHRDHQVVLVVEDDGHGFILPDAPQRPDDGLGLVSMRERAILAGGALEIETAPGHGTTIFVRVATNGRSGEAPYTD